MTLAAAFADRSLPTATHAAVRRVLDTRDGLVSVTAQAWGLGLPLEERVPVDSQYASAAMRDAFLAALEGCDPARSRSLARDLLQCGNPLPGLTCIDLGLPARSTYGSAARHILAR